MDPSPAPDPSSSPDPATIDAADVTPSSGRTPLETVKDEGVREKPRLSDTLWSIWTWSVFGVCALVWLPLMAVVWLVTRPFDRARYWTGFLFRRLPVAVQSANPLWHFRVTGEMPENPRNPYVVVANHESFVDILLISHLPFEMKWLSKSEMFNIPVAGWAMYLAWDVKLRRGEKGSGTAAIEQCKVRLARRVSVMVFPEGTRAADGRLGEFKDGAFRLAIEEQLPILPLAVAGTKEALRKHDWRLGRADAEVHVMAPVPTEGLTLSDVDDLKERVRTLISDQVMAMKGRADDAA